jgi:TolB-like protein/Tfp pilus assembly protein PilF/tRNA A-37 threonylcarbamoyl transferase component Bud32
MIGQTISHYQIVEKIGEGGMGLVYKAEDTKLKRTVALKFLPPELSRDPEAQKRFVHEAQAAAALDHPNICTVYEVDDWQGQTFIAMAYIEGQSLKDKIEADFPKVQNLPEVLDIAIQVAEGLQAAHEKGIVHRDIKSANIMMTARGQAKITDFGLAKLAGRTKVTRTGMTMGTAAYMSPEQARGEEVDHRTDIWSLGVVLYEMVTGQLPFRGEYEQAVMYSILNEEPASVASLRSEASTELELVVNKALAKSREERYQHAEDILVDLRKLKEGIERTAASEQTSKMTSIAVLPFVDMSPQKDQEYFCDGMAEELINALTHIKDLRVVARTSAFAFRGKEIDIREIGRRLNVETVLEGSVRKAGNKLRITAQLIDVADGYHLWSERFDREMEDVFAIQDEISLAVVDKLKVQLLGEEKAKIVKRYTEDPEAYNLYLKGLYFLNKWTEEGTRRGLGYFQESIEKDPGFALAYLGIADTYANIGILSLLPPEMAFPKAKEMLEKALEIDDSLYEAHSVAAVIAFWYDWNWKEAESEFEKALAHNPGYANAHFGYAWYLAAMGRFDEAVTESKIAQELDPLMPLYYASATGIYAYAGRFDEALEQFHKATELDPNSGMAHFHMGNAYRIQEKYEEAAAMYQKAIALTTGLGWAEMSLGGIYALQGERDKATQILDEFLEQKKVRYISSFCIAASYNYLGDKDKTFQWLDSAYQERDNLMPLISIWDAFDNLRDDSRFTALLEKIGLEE